MLIFINFGRLITHFSTFVHLGMSTLSTLSDKHGVFLNLFGEFLCVELIVTSIS